jgi:hypothetical protein
LGCSDAVSFFIKKSGAKNRQLHITPSQHGEVFSFRKPFLERLKETKRLLKTAAGELSPFVFGVPRKK